MALAGTLSRGPATAPELWTVTLQTSPALSDILGDRLSDTAVALTVLAPPRQKHVTLEAIFDHEPDRASLTSLVAAATALTGSEIPKIIIARVPDLNWLRKVASDFPPLAIGPWIVYGAEHREKALSLLGGKRHLLQIDAANAFGTGEHPTTRGCLLMLADVLKRRPLSKASSRRMLDMGCGSSILAIAWGKAHTGRAVAVDCDTLSVQISRENAAKNGLRGRINVLQGLGYTNHAIKRSAPYNLIMANIFARPLAQMAKDLKRNLAPGGIAILSGLLTSQANMVLSAHRQQGLFPIKCFRLGEWSVLVLRRKATSKHFGNDRP